MKRILFFSILLLLIVSISGCTASKSAIDVVTITDFDIDYYHDKYYGVNGYDDGSFPDWHSENESMKFGEKKYYAIVDHGALNYLLSNTNKIDAFEPDDINIYTVVPGGIIDKHENGKDWYEVTDKRLFDENGKVVEMTDELSDVFDSILDLEPHYLFLCQIFQDGDEYYVYLELNVNWFYPCELYHYDKDSKTLNYVIQFDNERIVGIRLPKNSNENNSTPAV